MRGRCSPCRSAGAPGVAANAAGATLNVTAAGAAAPGYLTVFPCDQPQPTSSNVNYFPGTVRSNPVFATLDPQGRACVFTLSTTHVIVDVNGWFPSGVFEPLAAPRRIADTRPEGDTFDDIGQATGKLGANGVLQVQVGGRVGVPTGATAAVLNVTVVAPDGPGYVTVYPCDADRPLVSNLNYAQNDITANSVVARLSASGSVCLFTLAPAHLIVDVSGTLSGTYFTGLPAPQRLVDSRLAGETFDGQVQGNGFRRAGTTLQFPIRGRAGIPANATAVALNVTAVNAASPGYLTLHPRNSPRPNASNVNYFGGGVYANTVVSAIGGDGMACLFASSDVDVLVDVAGYFVGTPPADTGVRCPLEFPIRSLWDGYPVGQYQMPAGRYVEREPATGRRLVRGPAPDPARVSRHRQPGARPERLGRPIHVRRRPSERSVGRFRHRARPGVGRHVRPARAVRRTDQPVPGHHVRIGELDGERPRPPRHLPQHTHPHERPVRGAGGVVLGRRGGVPDRTLRERRRRHDHDLGPEQRRRHQRQQHLQPLRTVSPRAAD